MLIVLLLLITISGCHRSISIKKDDILKVTLAMGGGEKPVYWAVQVDSSLQYQSYESDWQTTRKFKGRIAHTLWDSITARVISDHYMARVDTCHSPIDAKYELFIHYTFGTVRISGCANQLYIGWPNNFASWFATHHKPEVLKTTSDSLSFDTNVQYERTSGSQLGH